MKIFPNPSVAPRRLSAFTLVEMMIATGIYLYIFVGVMVAIQVFALRVYTLSATKLTATAGGRKAMDQIRDDIRMAKTLQIGTLTTPGDPTSFSAVAGTNGAQGNALQIFPTLAANTNAYLIYYLDTTIATNFYLKLYNYTNNVSTNGAVTTINSLASYITNTIVFVAEDFQGNTLSNNLQNNQIFRVTLQFSQWEYPVAYANGGNGLNVYDFYQLRTRVGRRALD